MGKGGSQRIIVCEGDTAESLSLAFSHKHDLDEATTQKLKELLQM